MADEKDRKQPEKAAVKTDAGKDTKPQPEASTDTPVAGGRYEVNGEIVDANGNPVKDA